jgi:radical SAM protein with 4Fe4S-binding SPASM domain
MRVSLVEKVMKEVTEKNFKKDHPIVNCVCSENGEPFLNPNILDILRTVRAYGVGILLFSNFSLITERIALALITENLTDAIHVNIDGASWETYRATKNLDLNVVEANLKRFIEIRNDMKSPIRICGHIITQATYSGAVSKAYGRFPVKLKGFIYEEDKVEALLKWSSILKAPDTIGIDSVMFWAERYGSPPPLTSRDWRCPNLDRVKHCAYINPEGTFYACCFDSGNELVIGNIYESSLAELARSKRRKDLIANLEAGRFNEIGWPCSRVDACQGMGIG